MATFIGYSLFGIIIAFLVLAMILAGAMVLNTVGGILTMVTPRHGNTYTGDQDLK